MEPTKDLDLEKPSDLEVTKSIELSNLKHVETEEKPPLSGTVSDELRPDILPDLSAEVES